MIELGVNIDHVATVRQARRTYEPDPVWAAVEAHLGGADGITVHLREDRRHIQDEDVRRLRELTHIKLNLEMAATDEMVAIACAHQARDGDAGARRPPRSHHRGRPRHRRARRSTLQGRGGEARRRRHRDAASSSTRSSRRSRRPRASARASARSTPAPMPTPSIRRAATPRAEPGAGRAREDPQGGRGDPRASACASTPATRSTTSTWSRSRRCPACASCTSATRS